MSERHEEMGMSDMQFKDHLRGLIDNLESIKAKGVSDEAANEIDKLIKRFEKALED